MNRLLRAIAIILLCLPLAASADNRYNPHISIGGHAGMAMSRMSFSPSVDQAWHNGMIIGFQARYQEEKIFGLVGELNFVQRGWNENFKDNT